MMNADIGLLLSSLRSVLSQAPVAHAYIPSYPGGTDQEDLGSKSAPGK
jgi:hypothetical protein